MKRSGSTLLFQLFFAVLTLYVVDAYAEVISLQQGLRIVAEKGRSISISRTDEQIAEAESRMAFSRMLPSVNASASWTALAHQPAALFGPSPVPLSETDFFSYSLSVQQTLFDFRGNAARYDASVSVLAAKRHETRRMRNLSAIEFVLAYLDLLEQDKMAGVASQEVLALEAHSRDAGNLFAAGVITRNDMLQAEVKLSDARQRLLTIQMIKIVQAGRLNTLLVRPLGSELSVSDIDGINGDQPALPDMQRAMLMAEQQRPELRIADETLKSLGFEQTAKKSEFFPRFFVKGGYDFTENRYQLHEGNWSVTLGLNINLFNGGATRSEIGRIRLQQEKLAEQRTKLHDEIMLELQQAMLRMTTARERLNVAESAVAQADENLRINRVRYEEGIGTGTDVLDAIALLATAGTNRYRALYDLRKSEAAVMYATGTDLLEVYK